MPLWQGRYICYASLLSGLLFVGYGEEKGGKAGNGNGQNDGFGSGGKTGEYRDAGEDEAGRKADENKNGYYSIFPSGRYYNRQKHAVKGDAESADYPEGQNIADDYAEGGSDSPARHGNDKCAVRVIWVQKSRACYNNAEQLIGNAVAHKQTVTQRGIRREFLAKGTAHEQVAGVCNQGYQSHLPIGGVAGYYGYAGILTGRCVICQAGNKALNGTQSGISGRYAERKCNGKISEGNRDSVPYSRTEYCPVATEGLNLFCFFLISITLCL